MKARYKLKKTASTKDHQATIRHVILKDAISTTVIQGALTASAPEIERALAITEFHQRFTARSVHSFLNPLRTGIQIQSGTQYTVQADYTLKSSKGPTVLTPPGMSADGDLYYRIGTGIWNPVNRHLTLGSDIAQGGELQFYVDALAVLSRLPAKRLKNPGLSAEFVIDLTGKKLSQK